MTEWFYVDHPGHFQRLPRHRLLPQERLPVTPLPRRLEKRICQRLEIEEKQIKNH